MMKLNNLLIGNLIFIFLLVSVYFLYTNLSTENNTIVSYMNDINSEQFNDNVSFNDKELYTIANIHHYGRYHNSIDVNKAIDMYHLSIDKSNDKTHIGNCYLSLGHLYKDKNIGEKAIFYYLLALKYGYEESIIHIGKVYLYGLHPYYLPEKILAGHIFNTFMNVSDTVEPWCKLYLKEINELGYHDIDAYTINKIEYKHLPNDIPFGLVWVSYTLWANVAASLAAASDLASHVSFSAAFARHAYATAKHVLDSLHRGWAMGAFIRACLPHVKKPVVR